MIRMKFISILPLGLAFAALPFAAVSAQAQNDDDIVYAEGTGDTAYVQADSYRDSSSADRVTDMAGKFDDPATQQRIADTVEGMTHVVMNLPIGRFAEAIERAAPGAVNRRIRADSTVADLAGRDSRDLPRELGDKSRDAMKMAGAMAQAFATLLPELENMGREIGAQVGEAARQRR